MYQVINCTPQERLFQFQYRSKPGYNIRCWFFSPVPVLLKKYVRKWRYKFTYTGS